MTKEKEKKPGKENLKTIIEEVKDDHRFSKESKQNIKTVEEAIKTGRTLTQEEIEEIENNPSQSDTIYRIKNWEKRHRNTNDISKDTDTTTDTTTIKSTSISLNKRITISESLLNFKIIKIILFSLIWILVIPTIIFISLGKSLSYLHSMPSNKSTKNLWYAGFDTVVIFSWVILGILLIAFMLIGIKQLIEFRKEEKTFSIKSWESWSILSAISAVLLIPTIVSIVFDSILINKYKQTSKYKAFREKQIPWISWYDIFLMITLISLATIFQFLEVKFIPNFAMECIIAVITCILLRWHLALIVLIISPIIWWITGGATFSGPISLVFDYHLAYLVFGLMCLLNPLEKVSMKWSSNKYAQLAITAGIGELLLALCFTLKFFSHVIATHYQLSTPWNTNVSNNGSFVAISFGITSGLFLAGLKPLLMLRDYKGISKFLD